MKQDFLNKDVIFEEVPLFAGLGQRERNLIGQRCRVAEYKKDQIIYAEGTPASNFYCIIVGRVVIYTKKSDGSETVLEYLHRGKYFGIISLLTGEPHSVTARAINDCLLVVVDRSDFDFLLKKIPRLAIDLSQTLSRRLKNKDLHPKTIFESTVVSIFSSYSQSGKTLYALNVALSLHRETHKSVLILDICSQDSCSTLAPRLGISDRHPTVNLSSSFVNTGQTIRGAVQKSAWGVDLVCLSYRPEDESGLRHLVAILSFLVNEYHYIILDLPASMDRFVFEVLNQSDLIHLLTSPEQVHLRRTHNLIKRLKSDFNFSPAKIKVLINAYKFSRLDHQQQEAVLGHDIFATLPRSELGAVERLVVDRPASEYARAVRRIARVLGDCQVGLALGVGVAYGYCHVGVLKVIEDEKIPIDVITGSSMGAYIASLWAIGYSSGQILEIIERYRQPKDIWGMIDFTMPFFGFLKGNKLYNFFKQSLGTKTFHDVNLPLKIIATDIRRKEYRILDKGLLVDALMASCSMPGVFMPFKFKDEVLFDGGMSSPLPTEPLLSMGIKKIIAVNVTPSKADILRQYDTIKQELATTYDTAGQHKWLSLTEYLKKRFKTNILDIIFSSIEVMQSEIALRESLLADVVLHPDVTGIHWLELHRAREFARRGEEETRKNLDRIWQVINE